MGCSWGDLGPQLLPVTYFQYPQSGSMGCSLELRLRSRNSSVRNFQYPQSGSMGCSAREAGEAGEADAPFSIPKADRWAAAWHWAPWAPASSPTFSIPKADRWAAAWRRTVRGSRGGRLSVSPKRIDGLQRRPLPRPLPPRRHLSVSPKRIDGLQRA